MILFVTSYDMATELNLQVAKMVSGTMSCLFGPDATRDMLWKLLQSDEHTSIVAMSHGRRRWIFADGGSAAAHAINIDDMKSFKNRRIFSWACMTSAELGVQASKSNNVWFGFPVKIAAPPEDAKLQMELSGIFQILIGNMDGVVDERTCRELLDRLVDAAESVLFSTQDILSSSEQQCFEQFWMRLEAWMPGLDEPIRPTIAHHKREDDADPLSDLL